LGSQNLPRLYVRARRNEFKTRTKIPDSFRRRYSKLSVGRVRLRSSVSVFFKRIVLAFFVYRVQPEIGVRTREETKPIGLLYETGKFFSPVKSFSSYRNCADAVKLPVLHPFTNARREEEILSNDERFVPRVRLRTSGRATRVRRRAIIWQER